MSSDKVHQQHVEKEHPLILRTTSQASHTIAGKPLQKAATLCHTIVGKPLQEYIAHLQEEDKVLDQIASRQLNSQQIRELVSEDVGPTYSVQHKPNPEMVASYDTEGLGLPQLTKFT